VTVGDARVRSETEFVGLFRREYPAIVRLAYLMLGDRALAEDVAQEAFTRMYARWWRVSRYERPGAWVRRVAIRLAGRSRSLRVREGAPLPADVRAPTPSGPHLELQEAIVRLPAAQRAAIVLHYYEDRPVAVVAQLLGCSTPTAKVHLHRGRKRLERFLEEARHVG